MYITDEFEDENINSIRSKSLTLIRDIVKGTEDDNLISSFLRVLISELLTGINLDTYGELQKIDDHNMLTGYLLKMNNNKVCSMLREEATLLIIGNLSEDLFILMDKNILSVQEIDSFGKYIIDVVSRPITCINSKYLVGRALWTITRVLSCFKQTHSVLYGFFEASNRCLTSSTSDQAIKLVACSAITSICQIFKEIVIDEDYITDSFHALVNLLSTTQDNIYVPIETLTYLTKVNRDRALVVPQENAKKIIDIYSKFYEDSLIGTKLLELIKLWCKDQRSARHLINLFMPLSIKVFDEFFKSLKNKDNQNSNFEQIKNTMITAHGEADADLKSSVDMLPNLIDIIHLLLNYCLETDDKENLQYIMMIVNVICEILSNSSDTQIMQKGTILLKNFIPSCRSLILEK